MPSERTQTTSMANTYSQDGGAELREDQRVTTAGTSGTQGEGSHNAYPLPSEVGERERERQAQQENEQSTSQQSSEGSGEQQQQQSSESSGSSEGQQQESSDSGEQKEESSGGEQKEKSSGGGDDAAQSKSSSKKSPGRVQENTEAIPTAGGERLGEKHWGESKTVPDVPKSRQEENVSSSEGQPDSKHIGTLRVAITDNYAEQTQDNTAQNTGSTEQSGDSSEEPKQGMVDKIKDKLGLSSS